jgi:hypothetical protein
MDFHWRAGPCGGIIAAVVPASPLPASVAIDARVNPPCPLLPAIDRIHDPTLTRRHGADRGAAFYLDALRYAQSQWMSGKPAQAVLQLDKAWMADLAGAPEVLDRHPSPYAALVWILHAATDGTRGFLGNPVRHFQHLASRMSGPRRDVRSWRAWACMHLARKVGPPGAFPHDGRQLVREGLWLPAESATIAALHRHGWPGEAAIVRTAVALASSTSLPADV